MTRQSPVQACPSVSTAVPSTLSSWCPDPSVARSIREDTLPISRPEGGVTFIYTLNMLVPPLSRPS